MKLTQQDRLSKSLGFIWKVILSIFRPSYDETSLFLIALTTTLLLFQYQSLNKTLEFVFSPLPTSEYYSKDPRFLVFLFAFIFLWGYVASIFHAFVRTGKSIIDKISMAAFAMTVNGVVGISVGIEMLQQSSRGLLFFPLVNIFSGVAIIYQIGLQAEKTIRDEDVSMQDIVISSVILLVMYLACQLYKLSWALTFSISLMYATLLHNSAKTLIYLWRNR